MIDWTILLKELLPQMPLAGVFLWVAHAALEREEKRYCDLIETFKEEVKACEERYRQVFAELMRIKEKINNRS